MGARTAGYLFLVVASLVLASCSRSGLISPSPSPAPSSPPVAPPQSASPVPTDQSVNTYFIDLLGNASGEVIGCEDTLVALPQPANLANLTLEEKIRVALQTLLAAGATTLADQSLYTALGSANLQVERVANDAGSVSVYLTGTLSLGGACDNPRVEAQLKKTVQQFPEVNSVTIYINGQKLEVFLSQQ